MDEVTSLKILWGIRYLVFSSVCAVLHFLFTSTFLMEYSKLTLVGTSSVFSYFHPAYSGLSGFMLFVWVVGSIICIAMYYSNEKKLKTAAEQKSEDSSVNQDK